MSIRRRQITTCMIDSPGTSLNTITPCVACKLMRRRCAKECPFSPYFSPHEPQNFAAVHKVFGASNVFKMLLDVQEAQRADVANSLAYEANVRLRDPIYGCMGAIFALQQQVQTLQLELNVVRAEILRYKCREGAKSIISTVSPGTAAFAISMAELQQAPPTPSPSPPALAVGTLLLPSIVVSSSTDPTSLYTSTLSTSNYNSISSDKHHISYFD